MKDPKWLAGRGDWPTTTGQVGNVSADRNRRRLGKADDELVGWFRSNVGVRAQGYEPGHAFESPRAHLAMLRGMFAGEMKWFDRVAGSVAKLAEAEREILSLVYTPRSAPTWLADALSTPWGGGSFVALAATLPRAAEAAQGKHVPSWLESLGRGSHKKLLTELSRDCEALRIPALGVYETLRVERVKREQAEEREAERDRSQRNVALIAELTGRSERKRRARFDARLRRAS